MAAKTSDNKLVATISDYQATFDTVYGKRVLRHLMKVHGMMNASFISDPLALAYNEGGRNAVVQILNKCRVDVKKLEDEIRETNLQGESDVII